VNNLKSEQHFLASCEVRLLLPASGEIQSLSFPPKFFLDICEILDPRASNFMNTKMNNRRLNKSRIGKHKTFTNYEHNYELNTKNERKKWCRYVYGTNIKYYRCKFLSHGSDGKLPRGNTSDICSNGSFFFQVNFYVSTGPRKVVRIVSGFESSLQKRVNNAVPNVVAPLVYLLKKLPPYIGSLLRPPPRPIPSSFSYTMASSTSSPD